MWYKVRFRPLSGFVSEVSSDILWGHLLWAVRYVFSEAELKRLLENMKNDVFKGILCTSLFPEKNSVEYLPALKYPTNPENPEMKQLKKIKYIPKGKLDTLRGEFTFERYEQMLLSLIGGRDSFQTSGWLDFIYDLQMHNIINRRSNTVNAGGLFSSQTTCLPEGVALYAYVYFPYDTEKFKQILEYFLASGFGADKSTGKGRFCIDLKKDVQVIDDGVFSFSGSSNAFASLSLYSPLPEELNLEKSFYKVKPKIGRLGEAFSRKNPYYKRPLWFLEEGSVCLPLEKKQVYGKLAENVHTDNSICHYALGIPYWLNMEEF